MQATAQTLQAINVTQFVMLMAGLSLGVERAVETIKGIVPPLGQSIQPPPNATDDQKAKARKQDEIRGAIVRLIAIACGAVAAYAAKGQLETSAPFIANLHSLGYVIVGLLTAGGSAFWNQVLDLLTALKTQQETKTAQQKQPQPAQQQPPQPQPPQPAPQVAAAAGGK
jgi:hypothetical protein